MKPRKRAQPQTPKWRNPIDDPATFERIDELLGALSRDPNRFGRYELTAPQEERELISLYAAKGRPADARSGIRHVIACMLSASWQFPEHYGPTAPPDVRRSSHLRLLLGDSAIDDEKTLTVRRSAASHLLNRIEGLPDSEQ